MILRALGVPFVVLGVGLRWAGRAFLWAVVFPACMVWLGAVGEKRAKKWLAEYEAKKRRQA